MLSKIRDALQRSERVVFLGFGFHRQNMELFGKPTTLTANKETLATVMGISGSDQRIVINRIEGMFTEKIKGARALMGPRAYDDCKCYELLDRYRLTLTD